jgi:hypothetical protein
MTMAMREATMRAAPLIEYYVPKATNMIYIALLTSMVSL